MNHTLYNIESILDKDYSENIKSNITHDMKISLKFYSLFTYKTISRLLINGKTSKDIENIRGTIRLCSLPAPITVYHGTSNKIFNGERINKFALHDDILRTKTFLSTSLNSQCALRFMHKNHGDDKVLLYIYIPQGYPALWFKPLSLCKDEKEILLIDGINLEIDSYMLDVVDETAIGYHDIVRTIAR